MTRLTLRMVGALALPTLALSLVLTSCARSGQPPASTDGPASATPSASATQIIDDAPQILADGRHPVYVKTIDVPSGQVTFDLIRFLTGEEAKAEWLKENPGATEGPPNDFFIVNVNPKLRTLPVAAGVTVEVLNLDLPGSTMLTITLADLPAHVTAAGGAFPFWLTVVGAQIVKIEEQYLP